MKRSWKDSLPNIEKKAAALRRKEYETATIENNIADQEKALDELRAKGSGDQSLEEIFQTLTSTEDPVARAAAILG